MCTDRRTGNTKDRTLSLEAAQVAGKLAQHLDSTILHLMGDNGKREGSLISFGSVTGDQGKSLKIQTAEPHRGNWKDWATDERGDLLDLWAISRNITITQAMKDAQVWLGEPMLPEQVQTKKMYTTPPPAGVAALQVSKAREYLLEERKLTWKAVDQYMVCYDKEKDVIAFPYIATAGAAAVRYKYLGVERKDGKKRMFSSKDSQPCLFGWQAIPPTAREVVITEGEIDSISVASFDTGHFGLSLPNGAGDLSWIEHDHERLARMDMIYLMLDSDPVGQQHVSTIVERLGPHRCKVIDIPSPHKDANDLLVAGLMPDSFKGILSKARTLDPEGIIMVDSLRSQIKDIIKEGFDSASAIEMPWDKLHGKLRLRPCEVSLLAGINGHGKSELATQIALAAMNQGYKVGLASLEWAKSLCMFRMMRQAGAMDVETMTEDYQDAIIDYYNERLVLFGVTGTEKFDHIMGQLEYLRKRYGIDLFVIDNLAKLGIGEDDYNGQKEVVDKLSDFVNEHKCHVLLVAHGRKSQDESHIIGKMDVKGTGAIVDMVKTGFSIWRNKSKETVMRRRQAGFTLTDRENKKLAESDAILRCFKQNAGEWEGDCKLWFDHTSHQYVGSPRIKPKAYVDYSSLRDGGYE